MNNEQRQLFDDLVTRHSQHETDQILARQTYWKAFGILDRREPSDRQGINWTSDDDPVLSAKQKVITYATKDDSYQLMLTNFHRKPPVDSIDGTISLELYPGDVSLKDMKGRVGEILFTLTSEGELTSPLHSIDASLARLIGGPIPRTSRTTTGNE